MESTLKARSYFKEAVCGYSWMDYIQKQKGSTVESSLDTLIELAVKFVEAQSTTKFGYLTEVSNNTNLCNSITAIPNIYDTALVINWILASGVSLSPTVLDSTTQLLLRNESLQGLWNYFHQDTLILPDDIDTASSAAMALLSCGMSEENVARMAKTFLEKVVIHEDGLIDVYFPMTSIKKPATGLAATLLENWPVVRRVDLAATANFLYLQNRVGIYHLPKLSACYEILKQALHALHAKDYKNPILLSYAKSYKNVDLVCFLIARLLPVSPYAKEIFKDVLAKVVADRLLSNSNNPVSSACRILAGINAGLLGSQKYKEYISKEVQNLLSMQNKEDFGFPKMGIYNAHNEYHFGSRALSTALCIAALETYRKHQSANTEYSR